jgi:hypothetical protein
MPLNRGWYCNIVVGSNKEPEHVQSRSRRVVLGQGTLRVYGDLSLGVCWCE